MFYNFVREFIALILEKARITAT